MAKTIVRTRFAPSPSGPLHLGHAFAALFAAQLAERANGEFLLRIEDIDQSRARPAWERQIFDDLHWLGLDWPDPPMRQSDRMPAYQAALQTLWDQGLLYECHCRRRDVEEALSAPQGEIVVGPDGPVYPGTCRTLPRPVQMPVRANLRLDMRKALQDIENITYDEFGEETEPQNVTVSRASLVDEAGDVVLARRTMGTSYHLSVVIDDAAQQISDVTRGADLGAATRIHVVVQRLLCLPTPRYHHHRLIRDDSGKRLAKRDDARALSTYRAEGLTPADIRRMIGL